MSLKVKALVFAAVAAFAVSIVGCGGDEKKAETPPAASGEAAPAASGDAAPAASAAAPAQ